MATEQGRRIKLCLYFPESALNLSQGCDFGLNTLNCPLAEHSEGKFNLVFAAKVETKRGILLLNFPKRRKTNGNGNKYIMELKD